MKLLIQGDRVIGTATDEYQGINSMIAPGDFDENSMDLYRVFNGSLIKTCPEKVSMRQARLALHRRNLLQIVIESLSALPDPQKTEAQIEWEYATEVRRDSPLVQTLSVALGMTKPDIDDLFNLASTL